MTWGTSIYDQEAADLRRQLDGVRYENDRLREQQEAQLEQNERERQERLNGYRERYESSLRSASAWPDALQNQAMLCGREVHLEAADDPEDRYFSRTRDACLLAAEIWPDEEAKVQPQIDALQEQIAAIRESVRHAVAARLQGQLDTTEARSVAGALVEYDEDSLDDWLNW